MIAKPATAAVIGGGIIGSWTALHLMEAGVDTTLIEQFPLPHTRGSSHGLSRAFRLLGDDTLHRLDYSLERWQALAARINDALFVTTGLLNFGPAGDPYLEKHMAILRDGGRPCEWLDSGDIVQRFPMLRYPVEWGAAWDPSGGILYAHRCLSAVQSQFRALGGRIITARVEQVERTNAAAQQITLRSNPAGRLESAKFDQVVMCAGPWTGKLLPHLHDLLRTLSIPVTYWRDPTGRCSVAGKFPILFNARLRGIYALPSCEYEGLVKVLVHDGPEVNPDTRDVAELEPCISKVSRYVQEHLPLLEHRQPAIVEPCMYTMTPDGDPVIDRMDDRLVIGCGFSGSGFKHSPATGRMLAMLALNRQSELPDGFQLNRYALSRFI